MSLLQVVPAKVVSVTKSDATDVTGMKAVYVGTAGALHVRNMDGATVIFTNVPNAQLVLTGPIDRVLNATTAADLVGYYTL